MNVSIIFCLLMIVFAVAMYNANDNQRKQRSVVDSQLRRAPMRRRSVSNQRAVSLPNRNQLEQGLDGLSSWLPNDSQNIQTHKQEIIELILKNERPSSNSPINQIGRETIFTNAISTSDNFTPCEMACGFVAVDGIFFLMGLMGLHVRNNDMITRTIMREMGTETLDGFSAQIHNFEQAGNAFEKAKALLPIMGGVYKASGFSTALKAVKSQLSRWDYIKAGTLMATQVGIWFGTDGAAFVAEVALSVMSAETLIQDSIKANTACPRTG